MEVVGPDHRHAPGTRSAVTIGAYDGVHLGHRAVLGELRSMAAERGVESVVVTFDRHPAAVVRPQSAPSLLTDVALKLELLAACGIDRAMVLPFDRRRANETAEDFVSEVLVEALGARLVVVGTDFHFGHHRKGNVGLLAEQGAMLDFEVKPYELAVNGGEPVSSTRIRRLLERGEVEAAAALLGRDHEVRGIVVRGDGRGGPVLGVPTANVDVREEIALPAGGVYAGWYAGAGGHRRPAAISVGTRPTFYRSAGLPLVEAHLLDFSGDLYGEVARVTFHARVRQEQRRFSTAGDLMAQMRADVEETRRALALG